MRFPDGRVVHAQDHKLKAGGEHALAEEQAIRVQDAQFVLDELPKLNESDSQLRSAFDLDKVGMAGHSIGGATALQLCRVDKRVQACISMDGPLRGDNATIGFAKPCMLLSSAQSHPLQPSHEQIEQLCTAIQTAGGTAYELTIPGTDHLSFSDFALLRLLPIYQEHPELLPVQPGDGEEIVATIRASMANFFNAALKGGS